MKYSEFRRLVKDVNFNLEETEATIYVREKVTNRSIAYVGKDRRFVFSVYTAFDELREAEQEELFYLGTEISKTPLEEREEEKRYMLRVHVPQVGNPTVFLHKHKDSWYLSGKKEKLFIQSIFTESELENIDETGFIREEVTE